MAHSQPNVSPRIDALPVRRTLIALSALLLLPACDTVGDIFASSRKVEIYGTRIPVLPPDQEESADPALASVPVVLPDPYTNTEWPTPGGFADNVLQHLRADGSLQPVWSASAGEGTSDVAQLTANPVIAGGRIFVLDAAVTVRAFSEANGELLWEADLMPPEEETDDDPETGFGGGVVFDGGMVFAATGFGDVIAMDAATGERKWRYTAPVPIRAAPQAAGGRVFVITQENELLALAQDDGRVLWDHQGIAETAGILGSTNVAVAGDTVFAAYTSGEVHALRIQNGRPLWNDSLSRTSALTPLSSINDIAGRPVVDRGFVFAISHSGRFVAINQRTGERIWTRDVSGAQTPVVGGDFVFVVSTDARVWCLSRATGGIKWIAQLPRWEDPENLEGAIVWSGPLLVSDRLVLVSSIGTAVSVSPYTGETLGQIALPAGTFVPPIMANGTMYVLTNDAELIALR